MFKKGVSGNPSGRPKVDKTIQDLAREHCPAAIKALVEVATDKKHGSRVVAATALLDRGYGKPMQSVLSIKAPVHELSDEEVSELIATVRQLKAGRARERATSGTEAETRH